LPEPLELPTILGFGVGFPLIAGAKCGWFVARFHRDQEAVLVLLFLFAGSIVLVDLLLYRPFILTVGSYVGKRVIDLLIQNAEKPLDVIAGAISNALLACAGRLGTT
jgi:hypothetical protein